MMSFFTELKRRNVFKAGVAYVVAAWLILQVISVIDEPLNLPTWFETTIIVFLAIGFIVVILVAWAYELTPEGIKKTKNVPLEESITRMTGQKLIFIVTSLLALAVIFLVIDNYVLIDDQQRKLIKTADESRSADDTSDPVRVSVEQETQNPIPGPESNTLAVLPFTNLSPDADQEYFADGLTEELLNKLAQVKDLQVTGRTSSFYFKGKNIDLRDIGETLGVANILEGSVRKSGDQIRITAQLINAVNGNHLWSKIYDRELTDIFAIQDEIAESVTTALSITLGAGTFNQPGMTRNVEAFDVLLQCGAEFTRATPDSLLAAIDLCEQAIRLDPEYVIPLVVQWWSYNLARLFLPPAQTGEFPEKAARVLERMQAIAPDHPSVQIITATNHLNNHNWLETDQIYPSLIEEYGHANVGVNLRYAAMLSTTGRIREAVQVGQRARRIDPLSADVSSSLAFELFRMNRLEEAIAESQRGQSLSGFGQLLKISETLSFMFKGDREQAANLITGQYALDGVNPSEPMLRLAQLIRDGDDAALLTEVQSILNGSSSSQILRAYALFIVAWLDQPQLILNNTQISGAGLLWGAQFSEVRRLPGFKDLVRGAGLVDYWRATGKWADACRPAGEDDFECE